VTVGCGLVGASASALGPQPATITAKHKAFLRLPAVMAATMAKPAKLGKPLVLPPEGEECVHILLPERRTSANVLLPKRRNLDEVQPSAF
jgi:hypothetical protein